MYRVAIIGTGVVGSAVALLLRQKGYLITAVCSKNGVSASKLAEIVGCRYTLKAAEAIPGAEIILLATPDRELEKMAFLLAGSGQVGKGQLFYHMSGALPAEILNPLREKGGAVGSIHPLQSFASMEGAVANLPGSFFAVQGEEAALQKAFQIARDLSGNPFEIKAEDKPLYHMGACIASNYLVALIHFAVSIYDYISIPREQAVSALMPLIRGTLSNIEQMGPAKALTGPVARGDTGTVNRHIHALEEMASQEGSEAEFRGLADLYTDLYTALGRYTVGVAEEKGTISGEILEKLFGMMRKGEKTNVRREGQHSQT